MVNRHFILPPAAPPAQQYQHRQVSYRTAPERADQVCTPPFTPGFKINCEAASELRGIPIRSLHLKHWSA